MRGGAELRVYVRGYAALRCVACVRVSPFTRAFVLAFAHAFVRASVSVRSCAHDTGTLSSLRLRLWCAADQVVLLLRALVLRGASLSKRPESRYLCFFKQQGTSPDVADPSTRCICSHAHARVLWAR